MNDNLLLELENYVGEKLLNVVAELKCSHGETYSKLVRKFRFLPGHRALILNLKQQFSLIRTSISPNQRMLPTNIEDILSNILEEVKNSPAFSELLKEIIESAIKNYAKTPNLRRYSEFMRYFALYLFLLCGRRSYELICSNLPFPSTPTICEFIQVHFKQIFQMKFLF